MASENQITLKEDFNHHFFLICDHPCHLWLKLIQFQNQRIPETRLSMSRHGPLCNGCHGFGGFGVCDKAVSSVDHENERNLNETEKSSVVK